MKLHSVLLATVLAVSTALPARAAPPVAAAAVHVATGAEAQVGKTVTVAQQGAPRTYRIDEHLGSGWWSHAFRGTETATGAPVVIKIIKAEHGPAPHDSFDKETAILQKAADPHLPQAHGVGATEDGRRAMVMEYVPGTALGDWGKEGPAVPTAKSVQIGMQILRGARALERAGVRHNDIHPGNVVAKDMDPATVKVIDVGNASPSSEGSRGGAPFFGAPEHGAANDDVYAAGAMTIRLITGKNSRAALPRIANPELRNVLQKMTHPDPAHRYQTAQEGIDALRPFQNELGGEADRRAALTTFYGEVSADLANFGGLPGPAGGRSADMHTGWAAAQSPETLRAELVHKLDLQMRPGYPLSNPEALGKFYADLATRTNATGAMNGNKYDETPDWNAHYNWAKSADRTAVRNEAARRIEQVVRVLAAP